MKIKKIIIENYRSIKKLEIVFKPFFGLIGTNGVGKSNILSKLERL